MRIAEYKQIDVKIEETQIPILDEEWNETGEFETIRKEIPVMGMVPRDATPEEEEEMRKALREFREPYNPTKGKTIMTAENGDKYEVTIGNDGTISTKIAESERGMLL